MKQETYTELINVLDLIKIQQLIFQYERLGDYDGKSTVKQMYRHFYREKDPSIIDNEKLVFAPKFEFLLTYDSDDAKKIFHQVSIFEVAFEIKDFEKFSKLWTDNELQDVFKNKQLLRTVWPIFRQNVIDGLTRMSLPAIALPFLM